MEIANSVSQASLFDLESTNVRTSGNHSAFNDPAFAANKSLPIHRWVPWIAGFSRQFVQGAIARHLKKKGTVLDPFSGVGTTLVEAVLSGHDAIGFEINPYAALACRTKLNAFRLSLGEVQESVERFKGFYAQAMASGYTPHSQPPPGFKTRGEFYSPKVLEKVLVVQDFIATLKEGLLRDLFRVAFSSTMVSYSNYSYEPSLGRRVTAGKENVEDFPVGEAVGGKLREMVQDSEWMRAQLKGVNPTSQVFSESFFKCRERLTSGSVDLLITSPPYLNNYHYNRNTRPHLYWLGYAETPSDMKPLEEENFGKFWQTVRERENVDLDFKLKSEEIAECLRTLREKNPEKGIYGGNGWANYAASYFNDCYKFALATKYALKRRGTALVVIGNSILQGGMIPTDRYLAEIAESVGLELIDIHIPRATRIGNSIIHSDVRVGVAEESHKLYEAVVELRKR
ncbi:MAG: site-specific DNA-methyltransferase [Candidatus Latescibacteria bacterium]|nr:site-specific DNA-methyltransferase [Candidatus Latescibacterota bacterium]